MLIRDLPTKRVLVHRRDGKLFWQRYHSKPRWGFVERPEDAKAINAYVAENIKMEREESGPRGNRIPIYPQSKLKPSTVNKILRSGSIWMFPTRLTMTSEFPRATQKLPELCLFIPLLYTYHTPTQAQQVVVRLGQHLLSLRQPIASQKNLWKALLLTSDQMSAVNNFYDMIFQPQTLDSFAYVFADYETARENIFRWLPLITEINARQIAWQVIQALRESTPVSEWTAPSSNNLYTRALDKENTLLDSLSFTKLREAVRHHLKDAEAQYETPNAVSYFDQILNAFRSKHGSEWESYVEQSDELYDRHFQIE